MTQWAWGRVCSHGLLQTANHRHESLPGTGTVCTEILPWMHPPATGKISTVHLCPLQGATSTLPPGRCQAVQGRWRLAHH